MQTELSNSWNALGNTLFLGNSARQWIVALCVFVVSYVLFRALIYLLLKNLPQEQSKLLKLDLWLRGLLQRAGRSISLLASLWLGIRFLYLIPRAASIWHGLSLILIVLVCVLTAQFVLLRIMHRALLRRGGDAQQFSEVLNVFIRAALWIVGFLFILSNLGVNVTSLVAGLGIGGIAIALAMQNILGDIISAFSIFFDKPFRVGDFIIVGPHMGTVKSIGIKSTRIQALQGEEIAIPNRELSTVRIQNFKRMRRRRVEYQFKIDSDTPVPLVREVPGIVSDIFKQTELVTLERVNLKEATKAGLIFEVAYYVEDADHNRWMGIHQEITLRLLEKLREKGIGLA